MSKPATPIIQTLDPDPVIADVMAIYDRIKHDVRALTGIEESRLGMSGDGEPERQP